MCDENFSKSIEHHQNFDFWGVHWETDFYTPPVPGGGAFLDNSAPAVYKNPVR